MKTNFTFLFFFLLLGMSSQAQVIQNEKEPTTKNVVNTYREVDVMASYPGGYEKLLKEIEASTKNCKKGMLKRKNAILTIDILISKSGIVKQVEFPRADTKLCKEDIKNAILNSKQWTPAKIKNIPVNSYITLTVNLTNSIK